MSKEQIEESLHTLIHGKPITYRICVTLAPNASIEEENRVKDIICVIGHELCQQLQDKLNDFHVVIGSSLRDSDEIRVTSL